jgi:hypothetical protein
MRTYPALAADSQVRDPTDLRDLAAPDSQNFTKGLTALPELRCKIPATSQHHVLPLTTVILAHRGLVPRVRATGNPLSPRGSEFHHSRSLEADDKPTSELTIPGH